MRLLVLVLALTAPVAAQTCGGVLTVPLGRIHSHSYTGTRVDTLLATSAATYRPTALAIEARREHGVAVPVTGRPTPEAIRAAHPGLDVHADTLRGPFAGLFSPRDDLQTWTRCGFGLLRYVLSLRGGDETMTLDLYNVPAHIPVEAQDRIIVRPGRWSFDFADGLPLRDEHLRRESDDG